MSTRKTIRTTALRTTALGAAITLFVAGGIAFGTDLAGATSDPTPTPAGAGDGANRRFHRPDLTDAQKACLVDHGVTRPTPGADGSRPRFDPTTRDAVRAAAQACGITLPEHGDVADRVEAGRRSGRMPRRPALTDAQKACLTEAGVTVPTPGTGDARPNDARPNDARPKLDPAARDAFRAAAQACGLTPPAGRGHHPEPAPPAS